MSVGASASVRDIVVPLFLDVVRSLYDPQTYTIGHQFQLGTLKAFVVRSLYDQESYTIDASVSVKDTQASPLFPDVVRSLYDLETYTIGTSASVRNT